MKCLLLAVAPAMPNQGCRFIAGEPPVAVLTFRGKRNADGPPMKTFLGMMIDRGPQCLEIPARTASVAVCIPARSKSEAGILEA